MPPLERSSEQAIADRAPENSAAIALAGTHSKGFPSSELDGELFARAPAAEQTHALS